MNSLEFLQYEHPMAAKEQQWMATRLPKTNRAIEYEYERTRITVSAILLFVLSFRTLLNIA